LTIVVRVSKIVIPSIEIAIPVQVNPGQQNIVNLPITTTTSIFRTNLLIVAVEFYNLK